MAEPTQSAVLVDLAERIFTFGIGDDGAPFGIPKAGPNIAAPLRGARGIRSALAKAYRTIEGKPPNAAALADALLVIEGIAAEAEPVALPLRVCRRDDGSLVIDLGDVAGRAVLVRPGCWETVDQSPVTFKRTALTGALPEPSRYGDLAMLRDSLNVTKESWPLLVGFLVAALMPDIPHPVLALLGEQGTGKSTCARMLVSVIDRGPAPLRTSPRDVESWAVAAAGSHVVALDNVSAITPWLSDALCRASTGDGMVRRMLYSDSDVSVLAFRRVVMLTSIDAGAMRGDLADRLATIELERIDPTQRRTDADVEAHFQLHQDGILGALLDLTAEVLTVLPTITLDEYPRMADFAKVLAAVDEVLGYDALSTFSKLGTQLAAEVVDSDVVASAVNRFADAAGVWEGTASELFKAITPDRDDRPKDWPANAKALSGALRRCAPALRTMGVHVDFARTGVARSITLARTDRDRNGASSASSPSSGDARDARDAGIPDFSPDLFDVEDRYEAEVASL